MKIKSEKSFLDKIDLKPIIEKNDFSIKKIMEDIELQYGYMYTEEPVIFNCLSKESFKHYLIKRYNIEFKQDE